MNRKPIGENDSYIKGCDTNNYMRKMKKKENNRTGLIHSKRREEELERELNKARRIDDETKITDNAYRNKESDGTAWVNSNEYDTMDINRDDKNTSRFSKAQIHDYDDEPEKRTQEKIDGMSIDSMIKLGVILHGVVIEQNNDVYIIQPSSYYVQPELKQNLYCLDASNKYAKGTRVFFMLEKCNHSLCAIRVVENLEELK